jgi:hypothetical protein
MSKDNMLLGYARGKVGSLVFARRKGVQITRAYNANPANPKTPAQIYQRMKMYAPTLLYKKIRSRFFPFAYEDQKPNETAYNAFMRHNIPVAPWVSKTLASEYAPIPFRAVMSEGSIPAPEYMLTAVKAGEQLNNRYAITLLFGEAEDVSSVDGFSRQMIERGYQEGDLFTFVSFKSGGLSVKNGEVLYDGSSALNFKYAQIRLNMSDESDLESIGLVPTWVGIDSGAPNSVGLVIDDAEQDETSYGGCIIVTRKSGEKVLVSSSVLDLNDYAANTILSTMSGVSYRDTFAAPTYGVNSPDYLNPSKDI